MVLALAFLPVVAHAQSVRGTVMGSGTAPVSGVMVILLDATSGVAASTMTDERGAFLLKASAPGDYRLRTLRIGFRPTVSLPFTLAVAEDITKQLDVQEIRFLLDTVRVTGRNACRLASDSAAATFAVWEQVRTALTAVQLTAREQEILSTIIAYERTLDRAARRVREHTGTVRTALVAQPWHSLSPDSLRRRGFVVDDGADGAIFYGPGIEVLLSREFVEDHCFRLARSGDRLGISFEPNTDRKRIAEIAGTMWLDRATSELRSVDFGYVNTQRPHTDEAAGTMEFVRMKDGRWAISAWNIRMPVLLRGLSSGNEARVAEYRVAGGELSLVLRGTDTLFKSPPLLLGGHVVDSLTSAAVPRARLSLAGTGLSAESGAGGRFIISDVLPGDYTLEVRTPSLDSVNAVSQTLVTVTRGTADLRIRVPTGQQIAASLCGAMTVEAPGILLGTVGIRGDSVVPSGVRLFVEWQQPFMRVSGGVVERGSRVKWSESVTDARGRYRLCGVPVNMALVVRAEWDSGGASGTITIPTGGRMARADLALDRSAERGGMFRGVVVADSTMTPLPDAEILLPSVNRRTTTNELGAFLMADIPVGAHAVQVRRTGYTVASAEITFAPHQIQQRRIVMSPGAVDAAPAVGIERNLIASFEENRRAGLGYFMTREDIGKLGRRRMREVLARIPGASDARECFPQVYVNNLLMNRGNRVEAWKQAKAAKSGESVEATDPSPTGN